MSLLRTPAAELASVHAEIMELARRIGGEQHAPAADPGGAEWIKVEKRPLGFDYVTVQKERGFDLEGRKTSQRDEFVQEILRGIAYRIAWSRMDGQSVSLDESPAGEARWHKAASSIVADLLRTLDPAWGEDQERGQRRYWEERKLSAEETRRADRAYWRETPPDVRGKLTLDALIAPFTWFQVGGPADALFLPEDEEDLAAFLSQVNEAVTPIGVGSNMLVRDGGVAGAVIRLGRGFNSVEARGDGLIYAGAAVPDAILARKAAEAGIAGLEFFRGVPGTVGGACIMNAGCYGSETKDVLVEAYAVTREGERVVLDNMLMDFSYRASGGAERRPGLIFTGALFRGTPDDPAKVSERMEAITARRESTQPIREKTGGSTFKNPPGHSAWKLVDEAGWRGKLFGAAKFSELHSNFMINTGEATAADLEGLGEAVRADVLEKFGVQLDWEIKRIGRPAQA